MTEKLAINTVSWVVIDISTAFCWHISFGVCVFYIVLWIYNSNANFTNPCFRVYNFICFKYPYGVLKLLPVVTLERNSFITFEFRWSITCSSTLNCLSPTSSLWPSDGSRCPQRPSTHSPGHIRTTDEKDRFVLPGGPEEVRAVWVQLKCSECENTRGRAALTSCQQDLEKSSWQARRWCGAGRQHFMKGSESWLCCTAGHPELCCMFLWKNFTFIRGNSLWMQEWRQTPRFLSYVIPGNTRCRAGPSYQKCCFICLFFTTAYYTHFCFFQELLYS